MGQINRVIFGTLIATSMAFANTHVFAADSNTEASIATENNNSAATSTLRLSGEDEQAAKDEAAKIAKSLKQREQAAKMAADKAKAEAEKIAKALADEKAAKAAAVKAAQEAAQKAAEKAKVKAAEDAAKYSAKLAADKKEAKIQAAKAVADKLAAKKAAAAKAIADKEAAYIAEYAKIVSDGIAANKTAAIKADKENVLGVTYLTLTKFKAYQDFPKIAFNPTKPVKNPLTVYKLRNIVHTLPALDGLTRLNLQKLAKNNSVIKGVKIWKAERKSLRRNLILNNYKSYWFTDNMLDAEKAQEIVATIENAENFALRPASYNLDNLKALIAAASSDINKEWLAVSGSTEKLNELAKDQELSQLAMNNAKLEMALTHVAFAYSRDASAGQLIPSAVDRNMDVHPVATSAAKIISNIKSYAQKGDIQHWLEAQNPQSTQFTALLAEFKKQSGVDQVKQPDPIKVPTGKSLKKGMKSKRVIKLAMRLEQLGFYTKSADGEYPQIVSAEIMDSVKAYQTDRGLVADGIAGPATVGTLNYKKPDYLKTLLVNIERQRWMPRKLGYKHVLVNQAEFRLRVYENKEITHTARVVIGKNKHQTPMFFNTIRSVVVNPYWNIPSSILYNEMRNKIQNDSSYLSRNGYEVVGNMNWENASSRHVKFRVRQKPGGRNALGRVKFLFPNRHSIYLHDTPSKSLFSRASRAFSHGCVRVQNPELLALNLMGWSKNKYNSLIKAGKNRHFALKNKIPVYLTYMTASVDDEGKMRYFRDVYGRDKAVAKALGVSKILQKIADKKNALSSKTVVVGLK